MIRAGYRPPRVAAAIVLLVAVASCQANIRPSAPPTASATLDAPPSEPTAIANPFPTLGPDARSGGWSSSAREAFEIIEAYGAKHTDAYAGAWVEDRYDMDSVYSRWTGDVFPHISALRPLMPPGVRVRFLVATYSNAELHALLQRLAADAEWMDALPAHIVAAGIDPDLNQAIIEVSSPFADPAAAIRAHFDVPEAMLAVRSDGTGVWYVPWGSVKITIETLNGEAVDPYDYGPPMRLSFSGPTEGHRCDPGAVEDPFARLPCQVGRWTISVNVISQRIDGPWPVAVASGNVEVLAGETAILNLRTKYPPPVPWETVECWPQPCPSAT